MKRRLPIALLGLLFPSMALAWGGLGHRLVGALAADDLTPQARRQVEALLAGEPEPTLAGVANWADTLRDRDAARGARTAPWHYVNLGEDGCTYDAARDCAGGACVVEAIRRQSAVLADRRQPLAMRRDALKFVVHFIGDVHQPMHAAYAHDKGGNTVQLQVSDPDGTTRGGNLHSHWDSGLLASAGLDEAGWLQRLRAMPLVVEVDAPPLPPPAADWAGYSCTIATRPGVYPQHARLGSGYDAQWRPLVETQLRRAGIRLAAVLNAALGQQGR